MARHLLLSALILTTVLFSCNPDCDSVSGLRVAFSPMLISDANPSGMKGQQILITADPPGSLEGRRIFFNNDRAEEVEFVPDKGLVVRVPEDVSEGAIELRVEDPDCVDFVSLNFNVVADKFFENNPNYVYPPVPEIVIPTIQPSFPPSIENAWLSVNNLDYCLWFKFAEVEISPGDTICSTSLDPSQSREQCFADCLDGNTLYKDNPVSGVIDPDNNFVHLIIDRTIWGGGYEEFIGEFIDPEDTGKYLDWEGGNTEPISETGLDIADNKSREHMILLTSLQSGRSLLIYQQGLIGVNANPRCTE